MENEIVIITEMELITAGEINSKMGHGAWDSYVRWCGSDGENNFMPLKIFINDMYATTGGHFRRYCEATGIDCKLKIVRSAL